MKKIFKATVLLLILFASMAVSQSILAAVTLTPDLASSQPVYTTITWTVSPGGAVNEDYRFEVAPRGEAPRIIYDFQSSNTFEWTPIDEGVYFLRSTVRNRDTGDTMVASAAFRIRPRVILQPRAFATNHPLVALYSAPACGAGNQMQVIFKQLGNGEIPFSTNIKQCADDKSSNFLVAGMRASSTYLLQHIISNSNGVPTTTGPVITFTTGLAEVVIPTTTVLVSPSANTSIADRILVGTVAGGLAGGAPNNPFAVDLNGELIWYYLQPDGFGAGTPRLNQGGTLWIELDDPLRGSIVEIDLAGNIIRKATADRIAEQLPTPLADEAYGDVHHEIRYLPNDRIAAIMSVERILVDVQGPGPVDVIGDMIIVMDQNMQVEWSWNSFDHLDASRIAILDEECTNPAGGGGCPSYQLAATAKDWLHSNAIGYSPADGNLVLSMRHQDWAIKVDYQDGLGNGNVLWRLGAGGDFTTDSADSYPWPSHQHDVDYVSNDIITLYDNGNTNYDCQNTPANCKSRGLVFQLDENTMHITPLLEQDLGKYSFALGSAQLLQNGNYSFSSGINNFPVAPFAVADEITPAGDVVYSLQVDGSMYRSFRVPNLYSSPD